MKAVTAITLQGVINKLADEHGNVKVCVEVSGVLWPMTWLAEVRDGVMILKAGIHPVEEEKEEDGGQE